MDDDSLQHLLPRKAEINAVSTWASVKLRYIRDDLAPLIERGVPIKHLLKLLAPLDITRRRETLRQFVLSEFPEHYARYYAKRATAERIRQGRHTESVITTQQAAPARPPEAPTKAPKREPAKPLDIDRMLTQVGDFAAGKQFEKTKGKADDSGD